MSFNHTTIEKPHKGMPGEYTNIHQAVYNAHKTHYRADGITPYIVHPHAVTALVTLWGGSDIAQIAAMSHDVKEDATLEDYTSWVETVHDTFYMPSAKKIIKLVDILTKPRPSTKTNRNERTKIAIQQIIDNEQKYPEAILIKIADRTHNLQTIYDGKSLKFMRMYLIESRELCDAIGPIAMKHYFDKPLTYLDTEINKLHQYLLSINAADYDFP